MSPTTDVKIHVIEGDYAACSNYDNYSRLNDQCNCGDLSTYLMNTRISSFVLKKIFI